MTLSLSRDASAGGAASLNMEDAFEKRGGRILPIAIYRVDYTSIKTDGALKAEQFAWVRVRGAKDMALAKAEALAAADEEAAGVGAGGQAANRFSLEDMEGKRWRWRI